MPEGLGVMSVRPPLIFLALTCCLAGCRNPAPVSESVETDWPDCARFGAYSTSATPTTTSPEGFTRLLELRWSLADIRTFCVPERCHNPAYQNLVAMGEVWKGRLYPRLDTGFDRISWYANVGHGQIDKYSLGVQRGRQFWLLEIGSSESLRVPPQVAPDWTAPCFVGSR